MDIKAEILSTGDEVRTGAIVDSNSAYLAEKLEEAGVEVTRHNCVGDDLKQLSTILKEIGSRADVAVVTGGLGPTVDDITADAAADAAGVELVRNADAVKSMETIFSARHQQISASNQKQAMLPEGATCITNPVGTAPGFILTIDRCTFFFLAGVPREMQRLLADAVLPAIADLQGDARRFYKVRNISTFGLAEAACGDSLDGLNEQFPSVTLGLRAKFPEIYVKLYAQGDDMDQLDRDLAEATRWVQDRLGINVLSTEGHPIEVAVGNLLLEKKATIAIAESCTGGLISHKITSIPGASAYFLFSGVTYANQAKIDVLGVAPETIAEYGSVHEITAKEMAEGARQRSGATYGLATSGIAGPDGGTDEKPVGTICFGLATPEGARGFRYQQNFGSRAANMEIFAMSALDILRRELLGFPR
ncbi:MAG: CinA family nicotinamide mononucleotide deamidase-related protein [Desulfobacterales bacterium]